MGEKITETVQYDEQTLFKVLEALRESLTEEQALTAITAMQNAGILFRERAVEPRS